MQKLPLALAGLAAYRQFILYRLVNDKKLPVNPTSLKLFDRASNWQSDPTLWVNAEQAMATAEYAGAGYGVGFLFTSHDPFFLLDVDYCLAGDWTPQAVDLMQRFPGAAIELSQSGRGIHIIGQYLEMPDHRCKTHRHDCDAELYHEGRFVALTGNSLDETCTVNTDCTAHLPSVIADYFPPKTSQSVADGWTSEPVDGYTSKLTDDELIEKALDSGGMQAAFGGVTFRDLWEGNDDKIAERYPEKGDRGNPYDASAADGALARHLHFWTGGNCERIANLMQRSALVRDKWERSDYFENTITGARGSSFFSVKDIPPAEDLKVDHMPREIPQIREGYQYFGTDLQLEHFKGCVYVTNQNRIYSPRHPELLKQEQFNVAYGGYVFSMDDTGRKSTRKAWEAFTESQVIRWPQVNKPAFLPREEPGAILDSGGDRVINVYQPASVPRTPGDVQPFLNHLEKLIPLENDRNILLAYLAACVQHVGCKFKWAPVIQGVEGNGKSFISECVAAAIGERYTHYAKSANLTEKYNSWLFKNLFISIEDVHIKTQEELEILKPMITNIRQEHRPMQVTAFTDSCYANFIFNCNYIDGVRKTRNDRRFCVFVTNQQDYADLARDGLSGRYFPALYAWATSGGFAAIAAFLASYPIPVHLNPALEVGGEAERAPITSGTDRAIAASLGAVEQEIIEAIEACRLGFRGGWISSTGLKLLLDGLRKGAVLPQNKRRAVLRSLGYDYHPALAGGRAPRPTQWDNGVRPKLFVKSDHISANIGEPSQVLDAYIAAQEKTPDEIVDSKVLTVFKG